VPIDARQPPYIRDARLIMINLPFLTAAYGAGLLLTLAIPAPAWHLVLPVVLATAWLLLQHTKGAVWLLGLLMLTCGYSNYSLQSIPPVKATVLQSLPETTPHTFHGRLLQIKSRPDGGKQLDLRIHHVVRDRQPIAAPGSMRLHIEKSERLFIRGDELAVRTRMRTPQRFGTPGEFDYPRHLAANGLQFTAFLPDDAGIARLRHATPSPLDKLRARVGKLIDCSVPADDQAALVRALVIGDKDMLGEHQRWRLAGLGLSHLFSISGFHLSLVAMFCYFALLAIMRRSEYLLLLVPPRRLLPGLLVPALWCYLQITGQALPAMRAWLAAAIVAGLLWMRRYCNPVQAALAIAFAILVAVPMSLFMPSFQLSFAGVFGILIFLPRWSRKLPVMPGFWHRLTQLCLVTLAAGLTTGPIVLWQFHLVAPAGVLANLWAVPLIGGVGIPTGLAGLLLTPVWQDGAALCFRLTAEVVGRTLKLSEVVIDFPLLAPRHLYLPTSSLICITLMVAILLLPWRKWHIPVLLALLSVVWLWPTPAPQRLRVMALSVGQGDALLVSDDQGHHYLIDGGGMTRGTFDTGERLVAPALGRLGIKELTAVVLSHDHPDHRNGLLHIVKHFPVRAFWCAMPEEAIWTPLRQQLRLRKIPVRSFKPGWSSIEHSQTSEIALFVPPQTMSNMNDRSLAFYARHGQDGALLTGDLESAGVNLLLRATPDRPVTLLKLPHHGSRHSAVDLLVDHFSPPMVFTSLGRNNPFGFPHRETMEILAQRQLPLWRTDLHGTLNFELGNRGWRPRTRQSGLFH